MPRRRDGPFARTASPSRRDSAPNVRTPNRSQGIPTRSSALTWPTSAPIALTRPTPPWPGDERERGFDGQSTLASSRSVWQIPQASILTGPSRATERGATISSIVSGLPNPCITAAFIVLSIGGLLWIAQKLPLRLPGTAQSHEDRDHIA